MFVNVGAVEEGRRKEGARAISRAIGGTTIHIYTHVLCITQRKDALTVCISLDKVYVHHIKTHQRIGPKGWLPLPKSFLPLASGAGSLSTNHSRLRAKRGRHGEARAWGGDPEGHGGGVRAHDNGLVGTEWTVVLSLTWLIAVCPGTSRRGIVDSGRCLFCVLLPAKANGTKQRALLQGRMYMYTSTQTPAFAESAGSGYPRGVLCPLGLFPSYVRVHVLDTHHVLNTHTDNM